MLRRPAAALLRSLTPHSPGGGGATRRRLPPPIDRSVLARSLSTPSSPPPSSAAGRDDDAEGGELPGASEDAAGAPVSISIDRSGLYNPPGTDISLVRAHTQKCLVWV
jgi:NADH dehydrogenase [ubiquinone] 1 alpha subcomplex assembly factor 7